MTDKERLKKLKAEMRAIQKFEFMGFPLKDECLSRYTALIYEAEQSKGINKDYEIFVNGDRQCFFEEPQETVIVFIGENLRKTFRITKPEFEVSIKKIDWDEVAKNESKSC